MKRPRRRVSLGSLLMLALSAAVLALCAAFVLVIGGTDGSARHGRPLPTLQTGEAAAAVSAVSAPPADRQPVSGESTALPPAQPTSAPEVCAFTLAAAGTVCLRPLDGKNKAVGLTAAGWKKAEETAGRVIRMENDIFESWSQADQEAFLALSARYLEGLRTKTGNAGA